MKRKGGYKVAVVLSATVGAIVFGVTNTRADFTFGEPTNLGPTVNDPAGDSNPSLSGDGLSLYFGSSRSGTSGGSDIWVARRSTVDDPWCSPVNLGPIVNSGSIDIGPDISTDGLELYFESRRPGSFGDADVWMTKRATKDDDWGPPENPGPAINGLPPATGEPSISSDGLELYFVSGSYGGDADLFVSTRATTSDDWSAPVQLSQVNPPGMEWSPSISPDGRVLFFAVSPEGSGQSSTDIWMTIRDTVSGDWSPPVKLGPPLNTTSRECPGDISPDGRTLYFDSQRPGGVGGTDIWQVSILPIVDFNGDGMIDLVDLVMLIDNWGTDDTLYDIGPMPWGDGVVDIEDLKVFIAEWEQENPAKSGGSA